MMVRRFGFGPLISVVAAACSASQPVPRSSYAPRNTPCKTVDGALDLSTILHRPQCQRTGPPQSASPSTFAVALDPVALTLAPGERGRVTVSIANRSETPADLDLELSCDPWHGFSLSAVDSSHHKFNFAQGVVGDDGRWQVFIADEDECPSYPVRITLAASHRVYLPVQFDPAVEWESRQRGLVAQGAFHPGEYQLRATIPVAPATPLVAQGTLRVR